MRPLHVVLLVVIACSAFALRLAPARWLVVPPGEARLIPSHWRIDDPDTCAHARRIELVLAGARPDDRDSLLAHPGGADVPWPPLYDEVCGGFCSRFVRQVGGDPELGGVPEERFETFMIQSGPIVGLLGVLAVWALARKVCRGAARDWGALLAAAVVAWTPIAITASSAGHLDHLVLTALLAVATLWMILRASSAEGMRETLLAALLAGVTCGLVCASSLPGIALFVAGWTAFAARAWTTKGDAQRDALRAGLVFCFVVAFVGQLPLPENPELAPTAGSLLETRLTLLHCTLLAALPLLVGFVPRPKSKGRFFQGAVLVVAAIVILYVFPNVVRVVRMRVDWYLDQRATSIAFSPGARSFFDGGAADIRGAIAMAPLIVAWCWSAWRLSRRDVPLAAAERWLWIASSGIYLALALVERRLVTIAIVPLALALARAFDLAFAGEPGSPPAASVAVERGARMFAAVAAFVLLGAGAVGWSLVPPGPDEEAARTEFVRALRWMRVHTPASGDWAQSSAHQEWGVLTLPTNGALVAYHARRPAITAPQGILGGHESLSESVRALATADAAQFMRYLRAVGARYVVVGPADIRALREVVARGVLASDASIPGTSSAWSASMLWKLASANEAEPAVLPGLTRVYRADADVRFDLGDGTAVLGPAASIYALDDTAPLDATPELRAR